MRLHNGFERDASLVPRVGRVVLGARNVRRAGNGAPEVETAFHVKVVVAPRGRDADHDGGFSDVRTEASPKGVVGAGLVIGAGVDLEPVEVEVVL